MQILNVSRKIMPLITTALITSGACISCKQPQKSNTEQFSSEKVDTFTKTDCERIYEDIDSNDTRIHTVKDCNGKLLYYAEYIKTPDSTIVLSAASEITYDSLGNPTEQTLVTQDFTDSIYMQDTNAVK